MQYRWVTPGVPMHAMPPRPNSGRWLAGGCQMPRGLSGALTNAGC
jgi:hypothetical protein